MRQLVTYRMPVLLLVVLLCLLLCASSAMAFRTYTEKEFKKLSTSEREEYCDKAAAEVDRLKDKEIELTEKKPELEEEIDELEAKVNEAKEKLSKLKTECEPWLRLGDLENDIASLEARAANDPDDPGIKAEKQRLLNELEELKTLFTEQGFSTAVLDERLDELKQRILAIPEGGVGETYKVVRGDCLWMISAKPEIYNNAAKWPTIYRANRDQIKDPDLIEIGWVLRIPRMPLTSYTVYKGDCLWKIASYWEVYSDAAAWPRIYEANRDQIKDPDLIYPKQIFEIPQNGFTRRLE